MPEDTSAKPDVGSDAGQPITKLAALNGVCWPTRISPALARPSTTRVDGVVGDGDLEVLGGVAVGDGDGVGEPVDEHAPAVHAERRPGRLGAHRREVGELAGELGVGGRGDVGRRRDEHDRRVGAVLGLDQQVGGQAHRVGAGVGDRPGSRSARAASSSPPRSAAARPARTSRPASRARRSCAPSGSTRCRTRARRARPGR